MQAHRRGHELVMETDPADSVPGTLHVNPRDVMMMIKVLLKPSVIGYVLLLPFYYSRWKKTQNKPEAAAEAWW